MQLSTYTKQVGVLLLTVGLYSGCASIPVDTPSRQAEPHSHHSPNLNAAYNKPYKVRGSTYHPLRSAVGYQALGIASWYGSESGNRTAMGTPFIPRNLTAAHKTLPLPSKVRVTNLKNGRFVDVLVNDRGPFKKDRVIDLSHGAAKRIGLDGLAKVRVEHLGNKISQGAVQHSADTFFIYGAYQE